MEAEEDPVMLGSKMLLEKSQDKYLGDVFSSQGLSASVEATVKDISPKIKGSIYELRAVTHRRL